MSSWASAPERSRGSASRRTPALFRSFQADSGNSPQYLVKSQQSPSFGKRQPRTGNRELV